MKMLTFKIAALLGVVVAAPMILPGPDGKPIMSLDDWIPRDLIDKVGDGMEVVGDSIDEIENPGGKAIYSWRDASGVLHYSDTPVEGAEAVEVSDNTLEIPSKYFVQDGLAPAPKRKTTSGPSTFLLEDRSGARLEDLEAIANGDLSNAGEVLKNLPELLQQAKQARQIDPASR